MNELEPEFPVEFIVHGTPVSHSSDNSKAKEQWRERVRQAAKSALPEGCYLTGDRVTVTLYYFPAAEMQGDVDNVVKLVLDACNKHVYFDDRQVDRVVVQKFEPGRVFEFKTPSATLALALSGDKPLLYVRISNELHEDLK